MRFSCENLVMSHLTCLGLKSLSFKEKVETFSNTKVRKLNSILRFLLCFLVVKCADKIVLGLLSFFLTEH